MKVLLAIDGSSYSADAVGEVGLFVEQFHEHRQQLLAAEISQQLRRGSADGESLRRTRISQQQGDEVFTVAAELKWTGAMGGADAAAIHFSAHAVERRPGAFAHAGQRIATNRGMRDRSATKEFLSARKALVARACADQAFR